MRTMDTSRIHSWLSRNIFIPWVIFGPRKAGWRRYHAALAEARAGFQKWEQSDPEERSRWVLKELRAIVRWAGEKVPYYRELFHHAGFDSRSDFGFADYRQLPVLERATVLERADELIAEGFSRDKMRQNSTGGSTGVPVRFWLDERSEAWRRVAAEWGYSKFGYRLGDRLGWIWGSSADLKTSVGVKGGILNWLAHRQLNDCYRSGLSDDILDKFDLRLSAYQPDFLWSYTSALTLLARRLKTKRKDPNYPRQAILTGAEKLDSMERETIEAVFKVPLYESYGSREFGLIGIQPCCSDRRVQVTGANIIVEPYGVPGPVSGHEVLITDLHNFGMPFLRYRIGDFARFSTVRADSAMEYLEEVTGRAVDQISLPNGQKILGVQFSGLLRKYDVREYQVLQESDGSVCVTVVPGPKFSTSDLGRIETILKTDLGPIRLRIALVPSIERTSSGKLRPVVSRYQPIPPL